jgi:hypothetical protein
MANTTLLGLVLPTSGSLDGTWGTTVNTQLTELLDNAIAGTTVLSTDADVTLTDSPLVQNQARQAVILWNATGTVTRNITAPALSKTYIVANMTGGTQSIVIKASGTTGVTIPAGRVCLVFWDGADFVSGLTYTPSLTLGTALPVSSGGTGATTLTGLVKAAGTSAMTAVAAPAGDVVGTTDPQTMTNKRITLRSTGVASAATITPPSDTVDQYNITALAEPATFAVPSGSPTEGQRLTIRIRDAGVSQPITWASGSGGYKGFGTSLPSSTVAGKTTYVQLIYNGQTNTWDAVTVSVEV